MHELFSVFLAQFFSVFRGCAQLIGAGVTVAHHIKLQSDVRTVIELIRPPVYGSNGRSYKMLVMFFFFRQVPSELPRPIALKLCHMIGNWFD